MCRPAEKSREKISSWKRFRALKPMKPSFINKAILDENGLDPTSEDQLTAFLKEKVTRIFGNVCSIMSIR